ncbi:DedA family protein [Qipengyuania spongiae]|uniref:DedA family protein n=1 Tax=Qipengyuania spongiae TaxID=2909673 RepID=A0ABY5SWB8_9SPHN|nr:DedA family protein [Qipengyuania spongiae]UVI38850.1 DedA family protein [Qipengyuania spongiae]
MNEFIIEAIRLGGLLGIFVLMALENVFPPMPSEVIMGFAGVLVARGQMDFTPVLVVGTLGTVAGNMFWYWLGIRWREDQVRGFVNKRGRWLTMEWDDFVRARKVFRRHGEWIVFLLRFSPFLRTIISLPAGLARMKLWRFALFTFLGSLIWNGALLLGGKMLAGLITEYETVASWLVAGAIGLGVLWYAYRVATWKPRSQR